MPEITFQQAHEFLDNISNEDNVAIIHHDDADGFCSGIIFQDHCKTKGAKTKPFAYNFSKSNLENLPLEPFNKIIMADISTKMIQEEIKSINNKEIFITDHHPKFPLPEKVLSLLTVDQGYLPSSRTTYELTNKKKWLALIGTIADAGNLYQENNEFITSTLKELNLNLEEFQEKYSHVFSNTIIYFADTPEKIFPILADINSPEEIKKLEKYSKEVEDEIKKLTNECRAKKEKIGNINLCYIEPKYQVKGIIAAIMARENEEEPHIFISPKSSNKQMLGISSRYNSKKANLPKLLEIATKNLQDSKCGGHLRAAGGMILAKDLEKFKQNLKDYAQSSNL